MSGIERHTTDREPGAETGTKITRRSFLTKAAGAGAALSVAGAASGVFTGVARAQSGMREETDTRLYKVGPPSLFPESVVYDRRTGAFYGGALLTGVLYRATLDSRQAELYLPTGVDGSGQVDQRIEAAGVNTDEDGRLYVCGGASNSLYVYDIETKELLASFSTGLGSYINDVTITENGDVYFTDSFKPFIYRVSEDQIEAGGGEPLSIPLEPEVDGGLLEGVEIDKLLDEDAVDGLLNGVVGGALNSVVGGVLDEAVGPESGLIGSESVKPFNANGIRTTPDGRFIIFDDTNDNKLFRLTPPPANSPQDREIREIAVDGEVGDADGLEFVGRTLYQVDNGGERINKLELSDDYLTGRIVSSTTSPDFRTPTSVSAAPGDRLLVTNAELFDQSRPGPPYFVVSIPRP